MKAQGLEEVLPLSDFSVMGIFENLGKTYRLYKHLRFLKNLIETEKPDLLITLDFPGFNFRLGKLLKGSGVKHMHYVGPTVWAWRPWRAKKIAQFLEHLCVLFPFEPPYFEKYGLKTTFVGHPLMEEPLASGDADRFRKTFNIDPNREVVLFLPGSRGGELAHLLPVYQEVSHQLKAKGKKVHIVIPTLKSIQNKIPTEGWGGPISFVTEAEDKQDAYAAARVALAASGTIALELALARVPMIIAYKANPLTIWLVRKLVKVKHACMVNILLDKAVIPEFLQEDCAPQKLTREICVLLASDAKVSEQYKAFDQVEKMLLPKEGKPSEAAAKMVLGLLD